MFSEFKSIEGVMLLETVDDTFEKAYVAVRNKENRLYPDEDVAILPYIPKNHLHYKEWRLREKSTSRFIDYLNKKPSIHKILDIGCGNGWFANQMAVKAEKNVIGLDINLVELKQAAKLFGTSNCKFIYGDIYNIKQHIGTYDCITLSASIQYFEDLKQLIPYLKTLLNSNGEIHIIDSPFYTNDGLKGAKDNSIVYYDMMGVANMSDYYYHHSWEVLKQFDIELLYTPKRQMKLLKLLNLNDNPFPWIKIKK